MTLRRGFSITLIAVPMFLGIGGFAAHAASAPAAAATNAAAANDDIRDIHGPIVIPKPTPAWWYLAGAGGIAGIIGLLVFAGRRRPRPVAAHERALAALEGERALIDEGARAFSIAVSETVRSYVEEAFALRASLRTTDELLSELMADQSPVAAHRVELGRFLRFCDLAKFAGHSFGRDDMNEMLDSAMAFIVATAATVPPPPQSHPVALSGQGAA
ncbi:MAG TPA: hypothetical protein VH560_17715 [Polyangia bacterium]|jgi:hypothetical protein|nr:hypothetical protein [Polyangia bacterium]